MQPFYGRNLAKLTHVSWQNVLNKNFNRIFGAFRLLLLVLQLLFPSDLVLFRRIRQKYTKEGKTPGQ